MVADICDADAKFAPIIESHPLCTIGRSGSEVSHFESLVESVVSQQLAVRAAETIHGRLVELAKGKITPISINKLTQLQLRSAGLSGAKSKTIQGMSLADLNGEVPFDELHLLEDQKVFEKLNALWGIGPWTAGYVAMRALGDPDVFLPSDLGVRHALASLGVDNTPRAAAARFLRVTRMRRTIGAEEKLGVAGSRRFD